MINPVYSTCMCHLFGADQIRSEEAMAAEATASAANPARTRSSSRVGQAGPFVACLEE